MEQRYHAVMEVISGAPVTEVAGRYGVTRQAVHNWLAKYRTEAMMSSRPLPVAVRVGKGSASERGENVEFVAFWVGEARPRHVVALADVDVGGTERP
jgi:transposase-like protein